MPEASSSCSTLAVMARAPIPGYAKTRLIPRLGADGAAELHAILLERTLATAASSRFDAVALWCAPDRGWFVENLDVLRRASASRELDLRDQPDGDLGARMRVAFDAHLACGGPVVMVGTDCPELTVDHLDAATAALSRSADAVLLPAVDGGYAAIGLRRADPTLFEGVPWGTSGVLAATRDRIRALGWTVRELPPVRDVDVPGDVDDLVASGVLTRTERARLAPYLR